MPRPAGAPEPSAAPGAAAALAAGVGAGRAERLDHAADRMAGAVAEAPAAERGVGEVYEDGVGLLSYSIKVIALLGGLCTLGFLTVKVVGAKLGPLAGSAGDAIRVRAMKRLDAKTTLYLVDVAGKTALVGVSDREVRALSRLDLADASAGDEEGGAPGGAEMVGGRPSDRSDGGGSRFEALLGRKALRRGRTKGSSK